MFEMAAPIQSPAQCEVRSVIRFLNAKGERPAEIHKQIVAVYGNVMNRQNVTKWCREFSESRTDVHDEAQEEVMTWFKGLAADFYESGIQKLVPRLNKCLDNAGDYIEK